VLRQDRAASARVRLVRAHAPHLDAHELSGLFAWRGTPGRVRQEVNR
jgi:hypothetical protein